MGEEMCLTLSYEQKVRCAYLYIHPLYICNETKDCIQLIPTHGILNFNFYIKVFNSI